MKKPFKYLIKSTDKRSTRKKGIDTNGVQSANQCNRKRCKHNF